MVTQPASLAFSVRRSAHRACVETQRTNPFVTWLERLGPVTDFEELHGHYVRTYGVRPLSRITLVGRLRQVGVDVLPDGSLRLPDDWPG